MSLGGIDPRSVAYWDNCLYGGIPVFGTNRTSDVVDMDADTLRIYARKVRAERSLTPYGDVYYQELEHLALAGKSVLEFGCGAGIDTLWFAEQGAVVTACDVVPSNVAVTSKLVVPLQGRTVLLHSYEELGRLGQFDVAYSHGCLHHLPAAEVPRVVMLLCSAVVAGGRVVVMVYTRFFYPRENFHPEGPHARGYSVSELVRLFEPTAWLESYRVVNNRCFSWAVFRKNDSVSCWEKTDFAV